jgi:hypothetical protein
MAQLWVEPADIASRDMFYGPGGSALVPNADVDYAFKKQDTTGHSNGYEVEDPQGRKWKVKVGEEAQAEIVVSRILWALGYHQPVMHYLPKWRLTGAPATEEKPGRFRLESDHEKAGLWDWDRNPYYGTRPFRALVITNLLLNNWDVRPSNNRIYKVKAGRAEPQTWFVVQDVGGSLGKTRWPVGTRNKIKDFESQAFVTGVENGHVKLDYHARHRDLLRPLTPSDVAWTCRQLAKLTDHQLSEAFRAGGYTEDLSKRFIAKIKQKIQQGLSLESTTGGAQ